MRAWTRAPGILDGLLAEIRPDHTFVMVTHAPEKGLELATQAIIVEAGGVVFRSAGPVAAAAFAAVYREHVPEGPVALMGRRQYAAILRKDLIRELRTREMLVSMFLFVMLALVIFHFAFGVREGTDLTYFTGGMLWVTFVFGALLGLNRSFAQEKDENCLDGLLLCPVDRVIIFLAKTAATSSSCSSSRSLPCPCSRSSSSRRATSPMWAPSCSSCCSPTWVSARSARCWRRSR